LDFNAFHRTDKLEDALKTATCKKVLIDHHLFPDMGNFALAFTTPETSSASELLFHILKAMPQCEGKASNLPMKAAEALMTGMTTDTNNFNNSVYPSTFNMASELIAMGVDRDRILFNLFNQFGENRLRLLGTMLKDLMRITDDGVAYMVLDKETLQKYHVDEGDTEGFVNMPLSISNVRMSLLLKEDGDRVRVSIRSKKGVSANRCSRLHFNGGGHENAAGGRLYISKEISDISEAGNYVEKHTHIYFTEEHEA
jgi:phosphoesterase RecJ-like protein